MKRNHSTKKTQEKKTARNTAPEAAPVDTFLLLSLLHKLLLQLHCPTNRRPVATVDSSRDNFRPQQQLPSSWSWILRFLMRLLLLRILLAATRSHDGDLRRVPFFVVREFRKQRVCHFSTRFTLIFVPLKGACVFDFDSRLPKYK